MLKKNLHDYTSSAKVVDGNLILSLPDAINPIVWRMELGSVKASALEVRPQADGNFLLALKTPKGDVHDIAPYASREGAIRALMTVSSAMQNAEGKLAPTTTGAVIHNFPQAPLPSATPQRYAAEKGGSAFRWVAAILTIIAIIVLFSYLSTLASQSVTETAGASSLGKSQQNTEGVPQSADQALRGM